MLFPFMKTSWFKKLCHWQQSQLKKTTGTQIFTGRGLSKHETYFAIFCWQWRCYLCRAGNVSISRGEVSAYLQSVCIQIGFKSRPSVYCDAATLGELASVAGDGWSWIKAICELDQSLLKSPTWIGLKIPASCHIRSSKSPHCCNVKTNYSSLCRIIILNHKPILLATHWKGGTISIFNCDGN